MHDWVVWCKSKKGVEEICSFDLSGKEISSNYDETKSKGFRATQFRKRKRTKRTGAKTRHIADRAHDTGHDGRKATSK